MAAFEISLPQTAVTFSSRIALAPESWEWGGDGVTFVLTLETAEGQTTELFRQHIENSPANPKLAPHHHSPDRIRRPDNQTNFIN